MWLPHQNGLQVLQLCKLGIPNVLMLISFMILITPVARTGLGIIIYLIRYSITLLGGTVIE